MIGRMTPARLPACAVAAVLLAACGSVSALPPPAPAGATAAPSPSSAPAATPATARTGTPEEAAAAVAAAVPADHPRLMPASIPAGMTATVAVTADGYKVDYADDLHAKQIAFASLFGPNPPPAATGHAVSDRRQFRGARATYVIYDGTAPTSQRYLDWFEPGAWPRLPNGAPSNECFLEASGLTEAEFFQVADSLRPVG